MFSERVRRHPGQRMSPVFWDAFLKADQIRSAEVHRSVVVCLICLSTKATDLVAVGIFL